MIGSLSKWMSCLSDLDQAEREAKNPPIFKKLFSGKTVEQEALEIFAAKQKAQQQRDEKRQFIGLTLGRSSGTSWSLLRRVSESSAKRLCTRSVSAGVSLWRSWPGS